MKIQLDLYRLKTVTCQETDEAVRNENITGYRMRKEGSFNIKSVQDGIITVQKINYNGSKWEKTVQMELITVQDRLHTVHQPPLSGPIRVTSHVIASIIAGAEGKTDYVAQGVVGFKRELQQVAKQAERIEGWAKAYDSGALMIKTIGLDYFS